MRFFFERLLLLFFFQSCPVGKGQTPLLARRRSGLLLYYGAMGSGRESKDGEEGSTPPDYDAILDQVTPNQGGAWASSIFGSMKTSVFF